MTNEIPVFFHPTTVLIVDDDPGYLDLLQLALGNRFSIEIFTSGQEALYYIEQQQQITTVTQEFLATPDKMGGVPIWHTIHNERRFDVISSIIIDYAMPGMDGVAFCEKIKNFPLKKLMLTGEAGDGLAVEAFNKGLISQFIRKQQPQLTNTIIENLNELEQNHFNEKTQEILKYIAPSFQELLTNSSFINFFKIFCTKNKVTEYYPWTEADTWVLLSHKKVLGWLVVKKETNLLFYEAQAVGEKAAENVISDLQKRNKIPCFLSSSDHQLAAALWEPLLFPAERFGDAMDSYFAAFVPLSGVTLGSGDIRGEIRHLSDL